MAKLSICLYLFLCLTFVILLGEDSADQADDAVLVGEASDDIRRDISPRAAIGDKGYSSKANRAAAEARGIAPIMPFKANEKDVPTVFARTLCKARARIEHGTGRLKRLKRIALRCEKTALDFRSIVSFAAGLCLITFVHTAKDLRSSCRTSSLAPYQPGIRPPAGATIVQHLMRWLEYRIWLARIMAHGRGTARAIPLALGWATVGVLAYHAPRLALWAGLAAVVVILTRAAWGACQALREPPCQKSV